MPIPTRLYEKRRRAVLKLLYLKSKIAYVSRSRLEFRFLQFYFKKIIRKE